MPQRVGPVSRIGERVMEIGAWLRGLGLECYERAFREQAIDAEVLAELTEDDLKQLGVVLGHRKKLLKAIEGLGSAAASVAPTADAPHFSPPLAPGAERRQLTVMFVDLVGSTELSAQLDPEDLGELIRAYQNAVTEEVVRFEGHVAKYMGDGVLAYFGWPRAHEDEAERAVRAGLAITAAVSKLATPTGEALAARVGIATGLVVVGDLIGEGAAQEQAVVGETPNLAARLQALAEPGAVVIALGTRQLLGGLFELHELGSHRFKGFAEAVPAFRVLGATVAESRFEAMHTSVLTPLVGREHELGLLLERWERVLDGEGQVVLLSGEAGIGKSRLTRALQERLSDAAHTRLRYHCSPYHTHSALHPVIEQLERAAGFRPDDTTEAKLDKLAAVIGRASEQVEAVLPLLAALVSIPLDGRYPALDLTPQARKARTFEVLLGQLEGLAACQPVLMVFEDAHWIDPSTGELFGMIIERIQRLPVLLVITHRPEFVVPWIGHAHITVLSLSRLGQRQGAAMVARLSGGKPLPEEVLAQILAKTDGVPLFVEELTKAVLESELLADTGERYELTGPLPPLAIPATLHDSLVARLDRLGPEREVAQIAATIGREFSHPLLAAAVALDDDQLRNVLAHLSNAGLVFRCGTPPEASYRFKHALVRDVAYETLLLSRRQALHARIVEILEDDSSGVPAFEPELLAHHCRAAGLLQKAVEYGQQAGQSAVLRAALLEAIAHFRNALAALGELPTSPASSAKELELQVALGAALINAKGYAASETSKVYTRAHALCHQLGDTEQLCPVLWGRFVSQLVRSDYDGAEVFARELLDAAKRLDDPTALLIGHRSVGAVALSRGRLAEAQEWMRHAFTFVDEGCSQDASIDYGLNARAVAHGYNALSVHALGFPDRALVQSHAALKLAESSPNRASLGHALAFAGILHQWRRDAATVLEQAEELVELAGKHAWQQWSALGKIMKGWACCELGQRERGRTEIETGLDALMATGARMWETYFLGLLADARISCDAIAPGLQSLDETFARINECNERLYEAELLRLKGTALLRLNFNADAEAAFERAIAVARDQQARCWELRATTSLARLRADQSRHSEAQELLAPIYAWFTEGFDTRDLKNAKALLDELRARGKINA